MLQNRINSVRIKNYRSLKDVTVDFSDLTILIGLNGSGKSNVLDALAFVADAIELNLRDAVRKQSHFRFLAEKSKGNTEFHLDVRINGKDGKYEFELGGENNARVIREKFSFGGHTYSYKPNSDEMELQTSFLNFDFTIVDNTSLALRLIANLNDDARMLRDFLVKMRTYRRFPNRIHEASFDFTTEDLLPDGSNIAPLLKDIKEDQLYDWQTINNVLTLVLPILENSMNLEVLELVEEKSGKITIQLKVHDFYEQKVTLPIEAWSDGTLHILHTLVAMYQSTQYVSLVAIEEPENMIHAKAIFAVLNSMKEASSRRQIIVTTHSPDLLHYVDVNDIRLVEMTREGTKVSPLHEANIRAVNEDIFSASDLLRIGALERAEE